MTMTTGVGTVIHTTLETSLVPLKTAMSTHRYWTASATTSFQLSDPRPHSRFAVHDPTSWPMTLVAKKTWASSIVVPHGRMGWNVYARKIHDHAMMTLYPAITR